MQIFFTIDDDNACAAASFDFSGPITGAGDGNLRPIGYINEVFVGLGDDNHLTIQCNLHVQAVRMRRAPTIWRMTNPVYSTSCRAGSPNSTIEGASISMTLSESLPRSAAACWSAHLV